MFDASALRTLEEIFESTWTIVQARHPFRDVVNDPELQADLRRALFIAAETSGLDDLDGLQRSVLDTVTRASDV